MTQSEAYYEDSDQYSNVLKGPDGFVSSYPGWIVLDRLNSQHKEIDKLRGMLEKSSEVIAKLQKQKALLRDLLRVGGKKSRDTNGIVWNLGCAPIRVRVIDEVKIEMVMEETK